MLFGIAGLAAGPVEERDQLSEADIWSRHGPTIWRARRFVGSPQFYPVYRSGDLYSYSIISLILHKRGLRLNQQVARRVAQPGFLYYSGNDTIDRDITRIGGPPRCRSVIKDPAVYARRIAQALVEDTRAIEALHPGFTNVILCGGKDSCNLLLLPWRNPVLVASAAPNYELVKSFVEENELGRDVIRLEDSNNSLLKPEILINCCRNNLEHCRWGYHLGQLAESFKGRLIFWKGQAGDAITTPFWKRWKHHRPDGRSTGPYRPPAWRQRLLENTRLLQWRFFRTWWYRGAMALGSHMSLIRQLTGALVLSGYHGPAMREVLSLVDLHHCVQEDIRPLVGAYLRGQAPHYPATNPAPPLSTMRSGASHLEPFLATVAEAGIPIVE